MHNPGYASSNTVIAASVETHQSWASVSNAFDITTLRPRRESYTVKALRVVLKRPGRTRKWTDINSGISYTQSVRLTETLEDRRRSEKVTSEAPGETHKQLWSSISSYKPGTIPLHSAYSAYSARNEKRRSSSMTMLSLTSVKKDEKRVFWWLLHAFRVLKTPVFLICRLRYRVRCRLYTVHHFCDQADNSVIKARRYMLTWAHQDVRGGVLPNSWIEDWTFAHFQASMTRLEQHEHIGRRITGRKKIEN